MSARSLHTLAAGVADLDPEWVADVVELVRRTRSPRRACAWARPSPRGHRHVRRGVVARCCPTVRRSPPATCRSMRPSARSRAASVSARGANANPTEDIVRELWLDVFGRKDDEGSNTRGPWDAPNGATTAS